MSIFQSIKRKDNLYYRGFYGSHHRLVTKLVGVGPIDLVAESLKNHDLDSMNGSDRDLLKRYLDEFAAHRLNQDNFHSPYHGLKDTLDLILSIPRYAPNPLTPHEHVVPCTQFNSVHTRRLLESVSENPQINILYAYGVRVDHYLSKGKLWRVKQEPGEKAFLAYSHPPHPDKTMGITSFSPETTDEALRRMLRDSETLLRGVVEVIDVVELPEFTSNDKNGSLDQAAQLLIDQDLASV